MIEGSFLPAKIAGDSFQLFVGSVGGSFFFFFFIFLNIPRFSFWKSLRFHCIQQRTGQKQKFNNVNMCSPNQQLIYQKISKAGNFNRHIFGW